MANDATSKFKQLQAALEAFFKERDVHRYHSRDGSRARQFAHFWLLVGKNFVRNRCPVRASALAYTTLLALIPLLAITLSVTTSLLKKEGEKPIQDLIDRIVTYVAPALDLEAKGSGAATTMKRQEVVAKITEFIGNIRSGTLGVTSMIALVFVAIGLLRTIEATLNDIWGVNRGRGWLASITQYWASITLGPICLVLALGFTTGPHFTATRAFLERLPYVGAYVFQIMPFVILSLAFTLLYKVMPNTRVAWAAALIGGIVGGSLWQANNLFNVTYGSKLVTYSTIYGSLGLVPLFLAGLYASWLILLFGAQVAHAFQHRQAYVQEKLIESISQRERELVALQAITHVARCFHQGQPAPTADAISQALGAPARLISQVLGVLVEANLLMEVQQDDPGFAPARPLSQISVHDALTALRSGQGRDLLAQGESTPGRVQRELARIREAERHAAAETTLETLVSESV